MANKLNNLTASSSKVEEIEFLRNVKELAGTQSYCSNIFSEALITWASQQMKNDFSCDIMDELNTTEARLHNAETRATNESVRAQRLADELAEMKKNAEHNGKAYSDALNAFRQTDLGRLNQINDLYTEIGTKNDKINEMEEKISQQAREIEKLKAKLFDLMCPNV